MPKLLLTLINGLVILLLIAALFAVAWYWSNLRDLGMQANNQLSDLTPTISPEIQESPADIQVIAANLQIPWEISFLPDGSLLVTERPGNLLRISPNGTRQEISFPGAVRHVGESGLLGVAVHPAFSQNSFVYLYFAETTAGELQNRVERYTFANSQLTNPVTIVENIPSAQFHSGGRIQFGPDGALYITTGDASEPSRAQDVNSLAGKILRVDESGASIYSIGHRNPQGLAWDSAGNLWATEHGRSGIQSGLDELNLIRQGANYGWPEIKGDETAPGLQTPVINSGPNETWAPAGLAFVNGSLFFAGLRGETLYEAVLSGAQVVELKRHFVNQFGRLRAVTLGPEGMLYITTSNTDGRGEPREGDDKIIRVNPDSLSN